MVISDAFATDPADSTMAVRARSTEWALDRFMGFVGFGKTMNYESVFAEVKLRPNIGLINVTFARAFLLVAWLDSLRLDRLSEPKQRATAF